MTNASILRIATVSKIVGLSKTTIYRLIKHNKFPQPLQLGSQAVGWLADDITEWLKNCVTKRDEELKNNNNSKEIKLSSGLTKAGI